MKKNTLIVWLLFLIMAALALSPTADRPAVAQTIPEERQAERLVDAAGLLSADDAAELLKKLDEISERQACDVVIVTVNSLEGKTPTAYADDFFDYTGYGYGENDDGILFLISMEERDWAISTYAFGVVAFTDAGQSWMMKQVLPSLSSGNYAAAFNRFADLADDLLTQARNDVPYDERVKMPKAGIDDTSETDEDRVGKIAWSLAIAFGLSFIPISVMKAAHKSIHPKNQADDYIRPGSFRLTGSSDTFLYRQISKTRRESQSSSGGSRTHTSSSGRSHGGSSGKF